MKPSFPSPTPNSEERLELWLASQPVIPPPDFVERTLVRIRAEAVLVSSATGGEEAAIDALIDRWLSEHPLDPEYEPALLATQTRRAAEYEEAQESRPQKPTPWLVPFPAWARSAVALAAAACVALTAYFSNTGLVTTLATTSPKVAANNIPTDTTDDGPLPAYYALGSDPKAILKLSDSLSDSKALLNADNDDILLGNDGSIDDNAVN